MLKKFCRVARRLWLRALRALGIRRKSELKCYDPNQVVVTFNGVEIKGFMDGSFIQVERDPEVPRPSASGSGRVTLTLVQAPREPVVAREWTFSVDDLPKPD